MPKLIHKPIIKKSSWQKLIAILLEHFCIVVVIVSALMVIVNVKENGSELSGIISENQFEQSSSFNEVLDAQITKLCSYLELCERFEVDGQFSKNRYVDIYQYTKDGTLLQSANGEEGSSPFVYKLQDLLEWKYKGVNTVSYYQLIKNSQESAADASDDIWEDTLWSDSETTSEQETSAEADMNEDIYNQYFTSIDEMIAVAVSNNIDYNLYREVIGLDEAYLPSSGISIFKYITDNGESTYTLEETFNVLYQTIEDLGSRISFYRQEMEQLSAAKSNLLYYAVNTDTGEVHTNMKISDGKIPDMSEHSDYYLSFDLQDYEAKASEALNWTQSKIYSYLDSIGAQLGHNYNIKIAVNTSYAADDVFLEARNSFLKWKPWFLPSLILTVISGLCVLICIIFLTVTAGRNGEDTSVHLIFIDRIKTEIYILLFCYAYAMYISIIYSVYDNLYYMYFSDDSILSYGWSLVVLGLFGFFGNTLSLTCYLSLVRRFKARNLWSNSITCAFIRFIKLMIKNILDSIRNIKITRRTLLYYLGFLIINFILVYFIDWIPIAFIFDIAVGVWLLRDAVGRYEVIHGAKEVASGNLDYQIKIKSLSADNLQLAEAVNHIGEGLQKAVDESVKSERLQSDLITNVSHDIKTPLTSIITYVDLLKRENIEDPKIKGYIDVLDIKSQRLKNLTEDLVEASKISSGNITLEFTDINFNELLLQTNGEFIEKFESRNLQVLMNIPDRPVIIRADGRRLWRVIENLYNNAAKYALEGTRIYVDVKVSNFKMYFTIKNISESPLNIHADELTQRFIRGDVSRSTEGSGLGLAIAENLTKLQNGDFDIYLDGDLFKVMVVFPIVIQNVVEI